VEDAIPGNFKKVSRDVTSLLNAEKDKYRLIVDKFIEDAYNTGLRVAAQELSLKSFEFGNFKERLQQVQILQGNSQKLVYNLIDDVNKEITLLLTDTSLNGIPFTNTELRNEVAAIFDRKIGRLLSQVVTESTRATNAALEFGYKKSGLVTHKQWVAVVDANTSDICRQLNGEVVEIGQPFSTGDYNCPAHPNCRSRIVPLTLKPNGLIEKI
jgi:SPP1 gp7 family putative phage head morphogenesis protein